MPLSARKAIVASRVMRGWRGGFEFSMGLLDDLRRVDPVGLHRFLWSNHSAYAATYEISKRFGASNLNPSRRILFGEMVEHLGKLGFDPRSDIRSVFELGCSVGHLLRHVEQHVCPSAEVLHGVDIDGYAIEAGKCHLRSLNSRVQLYEGDVAAAGRIMGDRKYDLVLCCGVLMYMSEAVAEHAVGMMLSRARRLVGIICLAPVGSGGRGSKGSVARTHDGAFIHDVERMISRGGGRVIGSKLVGTEISGSSPSHVILAERPSA